MSDPRLVHTLARARSMSTARTDEMRRAIARRICFDLLLALGVSTSSSPGATVSSRQSLSRAQPVEGRP